MANKTEYDYTDIEQPYNDDLQRGDDSLSSEVKASTEEAGDSIIESPSDVGGNVMNGSQLSNVWLNTWMKSRGYKPKTQGFLIDGTKGYIECMKLYVGSGGIIGGSLDIPDTTSANSWHVDALGNMWSGAAALASAPFKALNTGAVTCTNITITGTSTVGGRLATTIGSAIDSSGDLINDVVNARINTDAKRILSDFDFGSTDYAGAVKAGTIAWNTSTGEYTSGAGVVVYRNGIVGADGSNVTFSISTTGDATFRGKITALTGTIGSFNIGTYLYSGTKTAWNDSNAGVHIGSDGIGIGNNVFTVNGATGAVTCSNINITGGTIQWSTVTGTGKPADNATVGATWNSNISGQPSDSSIVNPSYITSTKITSTTIESPIISTNDGYVSGVLKVGFGGIVIDGANKRIYSSGFVAGSSGWRILDTGSAEFNDVTVRGAVYATSGSIAGSLVSSGISAGNITTGTLTGRTVQSSSGNERILLNNGDYIDFYASNVLRARLRGTTASSGGLKLTRGDMAIANNYSFMMETTTSNNFSRIGCDGSNNVLFLLGTANTFFLQSNTGGSNYLTVSSAKVYIGSDYLLLKTLSSNPTTDTGGIWHYMSGGTNQFRGEPSPGWNGSFDMTAI